MIGVLQSQVILVEHTSSWLGAMADHWSRTSGTRVSTSVAMADPRLARASASLFSSRGTCAMVSFLKLLLPWLCSGRLAYAPFVPHRSRPSVGLPVGWESHLTSRFFAP